MGFSFQLFNVHKCNVEPVPHIADKDPDDNQEQPIDADEHYVHRGKYVVVFAHLTRSR